MHDVVHSPFSSGCHPDSFTWCFSSSPSERLCQVTFLARKFYAFGDLLQKTLKENAGFLMRALWLKTAVCSCWKIRSMRVLRVSQNSDHSQHFHLKLNLSPFSRVLNLVNFTKYIFFIWKWLPGRVWLPALFSSTRKYNKCQLPKGQVGKFSIISWKRRYLCRFIPKQ